LLVPIFPSLSSPKNLIRKILKASTLAHNAHLEARDLEIFPLSFGGALPTSEAW